MTPTMAKTGLRQTPPVPRAKLPSRTYRIDFSQGRIRGTVDGREAVAQAVRKILHTSRFAHVIYSWNYGMEWHQTAGLDRRALERALRRRLEEALGQDERVTAVTEVAVRGLDRRGCTVAVTVESIFGTIGEEMRVHV